MQENRKIKVIYIYPSLPLGGAEKGLLDMLDLLRSRLTIKIITLFSKGELASQFEKKGVSVEEVGMNSGALFPLKLISLIKLLKDSKPNVVHTHLVVSNIVGVLVAKILGIPVISTVHNVNQWRSTFKRFFDRLLYPLRDCTIVVSHEVGKDLKRVGVYMEKVKIIHNGVHAKGFVSDGKSNSKFIIGFVSRIVPRKGHKIFFKSLYNLNEIYNNLSAWIVGDGFYMDELVRFVKNLRLNNVVFMGKRLDVDRIFARCDVSLLPSKREGLPIAVLESLAVGVPVIVSNIDANMEVVEHRKVGLVMEKRNHEQLSKLLSLSIDNPALRRRLGRNAVIKIKRFFSIERISDDLLALYSELTHQG